MHKITLVCSAHRENGLCNARELLLILRAIDPEAVFEEISPSDFDSYYKHGIKRRLESQAITKFAEFKSFQQIPVDRYDIPANLFAETQRVFACVEQTSQEYLELWEENDNKTHQYGFTYLNSVGCATLMARMAEIEEETIIGVGDQRLIRSLEKWRHLNQQRELAMIGNIYEYCGDNDFDTGVFLVGAAHKAGIVKQIENHAGAEANQIDWNIAFDGQIP